MVGETIASFEQAANYNDGSEPGAPDLPNDSPTEPTGTEGESRASPHLDNSVLTQDVHASFAASSTQPSDYGQLQRARRATPIAPENTKPSSLPDHFLTCGCGECPAHVDPLVGPGETAFTADMVCPDPRPVSTGKAGQVYLRLEIPNHYKAFRTSGAERQRALYGKILATDRRLQRDYDVTTVLLTMRVRAIDEDGKWRPPVTLADALHAPQSRVTARIRDRAHLAQFDPEYVAITEGTRWFSVPHRHLYLWLDDPENRVTVDHFRPVLEYFVGECGYADSDIHPVDPEGGTGAITVRHDPRPADWLTPPPGTGMQPTRGAVYTAKSLPHLALLNRFRSDRKCYTVDVEAAATAWASRHNWVSTSDGVVADTLVH